jgi:hypothetical protein
MDAGRAPKRILAAHSTDQCSNVFRDLRPAGLAAMNFPRPEEPEALAENWAETRPSCRLASDWKAYRPLLMGTVTFYVMCWQKTWSQSTRLALYCRMLGGQNGNPGSNDLTRASQVWRMLPTRAATAIWSGRDRRVPNRKDEGDFGNGRNLDA